MNLQNLPDIIHALALYGKQTVEIHRSFTTFPVGLNQEPAEAADLIIRYVPDDSRPAVFDDHASQYLTQLSGGGACWGTSRNT